MSATRPRSRAAPPALPATPYPPLPPSQAVVLAAIRRHGPATSAEIIHRGGLGANTNLYRARFTELRDRRMINATGKRTCTITGRSVLVWQVSNRTTPLPRPKAPSAATWRRLAEQAAQILRATVSRGGGPIAPRVGALLTEIYQAQQLAQAALTPTGTGSKGTP